MYARHHSNRCWPFSMYRTRAIITRSWFETALDYKPRILGLTFLVYVLKQSVVLTALDYKNGVKSIQTAGYNSARTVHKSGMIYRSMLSVETISRHSVDILTKLSSADTILDILANSYRSSVGISNSCIGSRIPFYEYTNPIEYFGLLHIAKLQTFYGHSLLLP